MRPNSYLGLGEITVKLLIMRHLAGFVYAIFTAYDHTSQDGRWVKKGQGEKTLISAMAHNHSK